MYWFQFDVARAFVDSGIRATVSQVFLAFAGAPDDARPEAAPEGLDRLAGFGPLVTPSLGPHAIYTVDEPTLRFVAELAADRDVPVQIHLSETEDEVHDCVGAHGCRPAEYLDRVGLLTDRTVLAHGVWLDADELELVARPRRHDRHQPRLEHEAGRRARVPLPGGAGGRDPDRARHRRRRVEQLARPPGRAQGADAAAEAHCDRRRSPPRVRRLGDRDGCAAPLLGGHGRGGRPCRLRPRRRRRARAAAGATGRRARVLGLRRDRAERRGGRTGPDARSSRRRRGRDPARAASAARRVRTG